MPVNHFTLVYPHIYRISGSDSKKNIKNYYPEHSYREALVISGLTTFSTGENSFVMIYLVRGSGTGFV